MDRLTEPEPTLSRACCAGPDSYRPMGQFRVSGEFRSQSFSMPIKAGHGQSHSTDFNWLWLLPPTAVQPRQESSCIKRRSDLNPGSHHQESNALPTELQDILHIRSDNHFDNHFMFCRQLHHFSLPSY